MMGRKGEKEYNKKFGDITSFRITSTHKDKEGHHASLCEHLGIQKQSGHCQQWLETEIMYKIQ